MTTDTKSIIDALEHLNLDSPGEERLIHLIGPWMALTDLELMDVMHVSLGAIAQNLIDIRNALTSVVGVMDDDQVREAALRLIGKVNVYGDMIEDPDVAERAKITINWDGSKWIFITDPKLRMTETSSSYMAAKQAVFKMLERD